MAGPAPAAVALPVIKNISTGFTYTLLDSGTRVAPMIWRPYPGKQVRLAGGKRIGLFRDEDRVTLAK
jgi:hypothetical protein